MTIATSLHGYVTLHCSHSGERVRSDMTVLIINIISNVWDRRSVISVNWNSDRPRKCHCGIWSPHDQLNIEQMGIQLSQKHSPCWS